MLSSSFYICFALTNYNKWPLASIAFAKRRSASPFKICDVEMEMFVCLKGNGEGEEDGDDKGDGNGERG